MDVFNQRESRLRPPAAWERAEPERIVVSARARNLPAVVPRCARRRRDASARDLVVSLAFRGRDHAGFRELPTDHQAPVPHQASGDTLQPATYQSPTERSQCRAEAGPTVEKHQ